MGFRTLVERLMAGGVVGRFMPEWVLDGCTARSICRRYCN